MKRKETTKGPHKLRVNKPFRAFSVDASGIKSPSIEGYQYFIVCTDLFTNHFGIYFLYDLSTKELTRGIGSWIKDWLPHNVPTEGIVGYCDSAFTHGGVKEFFEEHNMTFYIDTPVEHKTSPA